MQALKRSRYPLVAIAGILVVALVAALGVPVAQASLSSQVIGGSRPVSVDVSGTRVVWADRADSSAQWDIFLYDGVTGLTARITDGTRDDLQPVIDGDMVVWVSYSDSGTGADIHAYDIPSRTYRVICADPGDQVSPDVSGRWVVWEDRSTGYAPSVKAFDLAEGVQFNVASSQSQPKRAPRVGGDVLVYEDYPRGSVFDADVVVYDLAARAQVRRIGDASAGELKPSTDGRYVVWGAADGQSARDVRGLDLTGGEEFLVAGGAGEQALPELAAGTAYWVENVADKRMHVSSRALPDGQARVVNMFGTGRGAVSSYAVAGDSVAWIENAGSGRQVRAILGSPSMGVSMLSSLLPSSPAWLPFRLAQISTGGDVEAPSFVAASVEPGETSVDTDETFSVNFSKPIDPQTITSDAVVLTAEDGEPVAASVSYSALARSVVVEPEEPLGEGTYTLEVTDSVTDTSGNTLDEPVELSFSTTEEIEDTTAPRPPGVGTTRVAAEAGQDAVELTWAKPYDNVGVTGYLIYAHTAPLTPALITSLEGTPDEITPFAVVAGPGVAVGEQESATVSQLGARDAKYTYYYAIRAHDAAGNVSALSTNRVADPHGTGGFGTNTSTCSMCHGVHGSGTGGTGVMSAGKLAARSAEACFTCHGNTAYATAYGHGSSLNTQASFYSYAEGLPAGGSQHRNDFMVAQQQECDACHSPHRRPYHDDSALSYNKLLKYQTGLGLAYNTDAAPFGNEFCFSCHGSIASNIADVGGMDAYANTAGDHNAARFDSDASIAHGSAKVLPTRLASEPGPQISCTACHNEHASPVARLIDYRGQSDLQIDFNQADLCYECHSSASTETRSAGSAPFAWNNRDVKAEFVRTSSHPASVPESRIATMTGTLFTQSLQEEFDTNSTYQTQTTSEFGGAVTLGQYLGTYNPPAANLLFAQRGDQADFDQYMPSENAWNELNSVGFNPPDNSSFTPQSGSTMVTVNNRIYQTRGAGRTDRVMYTPPENDSGGVGSWSDASNPSVNIGLGGDVTVNTDRSFAYYSAAGGDASIMRWRYSDNTWQAAITFRDNGGTTRNQGAGSAIAFVPGTGDGRLFVINRNGGANDGRLYYLTSPYSKSGNQNFDATGIQVTRSDGTTAYNRMVRANISGTEYLFIVGADDTGTGNLQVVSNPMGTASRTKIGKFPFASSFGDGCDLIWDGGGYLYAIPGGESGGIARIAIPSDPASVAAWGEWESITSPPWGGHDWRRGSSLTFAVVDREPYSTLLNYLYGTITTGDITPPGDLVSWGEVTWNAEVPSGTTLDVEVQGWNGSSWIALHSSATSPIDLTGVSAETYTKIRLVGQFTTIDEKKTPRLEEWSVSGQWMAEAVGRYTDVSDTSFVQATGAEFDQNVLYQTTTALVADSVTLAQTNRTIDPPAQSLLFGQRGRNSDFDQYRPADDAWNADNAARFNPTDYTTWSPDAGATMVTVNGKVYLTAGNGSQNRAVYTPPAGSGNGSWQAATSVANADGIRRGSAAAIDEPNGYVYYTVGDGRSTIDKWRYSNDTWPGTITFRIGGTARGLSTGSSAAYAPDADRLFVVYRNRTSTIGGSNDGRLFYLDSPSTKSGNQDFTNTEIQVTRSDGTENWTRTAHARVSGTDHLFILGQDDTNADNLQVISTLGGTPQRVKTGKYPFGGTLGEGSDLAWDGGEYLYALRGGNNTGFARILIPSDPANASAWGEWETLTNAPWGTTWDRGSCITFAVADPPPYEGVGYFDSGTMTSVDVTPHFDAYKWGELTWLGEVPDGTVLSVDVRGWNGSSWTALPALTGLTSSPVDLSGIDLGVYSKLQLHTTFASDGGLSTPRLDSWAVTSIYEDFRLVGTVTCYNCHNTHYVETGGSGAWDMSRASDPANTRNSFTGTSTDFCLRCHGGNVPSQVVSADTLVPYPIQFRDKPAAEYPYFFGWNKQEPGLRFTDSSHFATGTTKALCETCHDPHASDFNRLVSWTRPSGFTGGNVGIRANTLGGTLGQVNICYQCHGDGTSGTVQASGAANVYTAARQSYAHPISLSQVDADAKHSDLEGSADLGVGNRHSECVDCHDPHVAKKIGGSALHTQGQSAAGGALVGAIGVKPAWSGTQWTGASSYETIRITGASTDYEAYVCFKCHTGNTTLPSGKRDLSFEFNPANESGHNVIGNIWPKTTGLGPGGAYSMSPFPTTNVFVPGWNENSELTCSDCHTYTAGGARGPHGSSVQFMIDPAYPNPMRDVGAGEGNTAQLSPRSSTGMSMSKGGSASAGIICEKCHDLYDGNWSNIAHKEHDDRGRDGAYCNHCHVAVPHGWVRPRLIGYRSDPAPYRTSEGGLTRITLRDYTPSTWSGKDLCGAECSTSRHPLNEPYAASWP